nr:hypothetical protein [Klebsiella pneumoniae]
MKKQHNYTVMHWGTWQVESREGEIVAVKPVPWDKNPSRIGQSLPDAVTSQTRIQIGRAPCRERVSVPVYISVV